MLFRSNSPVEWARSTDGLGCDGIVDATGVSIALQGALEAIRPNGWISKVGWGPQPLNFSLDPLVQKNVRLQGSFSHNWPMWEKVLRMLDTKQLDLKPILGGVFPIDQWQSAFEKMHSGEYIKSVMGPNHFSKDIIPRKNTRPSPFCGSQISLVKQCQIVRTFPDCFTNELFDGNFVLPIV